MRFEPATFLFHGSEGRRTFNPSFRKVGQEVLVGGGGAGGEEMGGGLLPVWLGGAESDLLLSCSQRLFPETEGRQQRGALSL